MHEPEVTQRWMGTGYPTQTMRKLQALGTTPEEAARLVARLNEYYDYVNVTLINAFLVLSDEEQAEWRTSLISQGELAVDSNGKTWADQLVVTALRKGFEEAAIELQESTGLTMARRISRELGRRIGYADAERRVKAGVLQRQIAVRFGQVPDDLAERLPTTDEEILDRLLERLPVADTLAGLLSLLPAEERRTRGTKRS